MEASGGQGCRVAFLGNFRHALAMDKAEHARRLKGAMASQGKSRQVVADYTGHKTRTVTNWTRGETMPDDTTRAALRRLLGAYDDPGDPVEVAVRQSELTEDRQYDVVGYYKRRLREQREGVAG